MGIDIVAEGQFRRGAKEREGNAQRASPILPGATNANLADADKNNGERAR
jgi:hypothetical protein